MHTDVNVNVNVNNLLCVRLLEMLPRLDRQNRALAELAEGRAYGELV